MAISRATRFKVLTRDGFRCGYCGATAEEARLEVDHIHPKACGGSDAERNLVTACFDCNRGKRDRVTGLFKAPVDERFYLDWDGWTNCISGDELPRTQPRRTSPIDWTIPRAEYPPLPMDEVMRLAEAFSGETTE